MSVEAPERIWAVASLGMVGTGRWVTQGSENPHGNVEYVRADKLEELAAESKEASQFGAMCLARALKAEAALAEKDKEIAVLEAALDYYAGSSCGDSGFLAREVLARNAGRQR